MLTLKLSEWSGFVDIWHLGDISAIICTNESPFVSNKEKEGERVKENERIEKGDAANLVRKEAPDTHGLVRHGPAQIVLPETKEGKAIQMRVRMQGPCSHNPRNMATENMGLCQDIQREAERIEA